MSVIVLNDNNSISNILSGISGGRERQCILSEENIERLSPIIRLAHKIEQDQKSVFIEVKFDSKYNQRPKRLEIVAKHNEEIEIYKFTKKSSFERECLEVQRVIDELKESYSNDFKGFIVLSDFNESVKPFQARVSEISSNISILIV